MLPTTTAIPTTAVPTTELPSAIPTEIPTEVPTEAPTIPAFPFTCGETGSFEIPVQSVVESCYPMIYIIGAEQPDTACFFKYDNASIASGAKVTIPFFGEDSCGSVKTNTVGDIETYRGTVIIRYSDGCEAIQDHQQSIACEYSSLLEKSVALEDTDLVDIKKSKRVIYDADVQVLSDLHGAPLSANNSVLHGVPLYLNVTLKNATLTSTAVLDFISVVLTPKFSQLDSPLILYSDNTIHKSSAAVLHTHDHQITFKMESSYYFTSVTLKMGVSFENGARRGLVEIARNLQEVSPSESEAVVVLPRVLKISDDDRVATGPSDGGQSDNLLGDSSITRMGVMGGLLLLLLIGGAILYMQMKVKAEAKYGSSSSDDEAPLMAFVGEEETSA